MATPRWLWHSPQVSAASTNARVLLLELLSMFNGRNNGEIFLSVRDATSRLGLSDYHAALKAFDELQCLGLIEKTFAGFFQVKAGEGSRASAYRLAWINDDGRAAYSDKWTMIDVDRLPEGARKRLERRQAVLERYLKDIRRGRLAIVDSPTTQARCVEVFTTIATPTVGESPTSPIDRAETKAGSETKDSTTHIIYHGDQALPLEFIRADLSNFWRAASEIEKSSFTADVSLDMVSIERAIDGGDLDVQSWETVLAALELRQGSIVLK